MAKEILFVKREYLGRGLPIWAVVLIGSIPPSPISWALTRYTEGRKNKREHRLRVTDHIDRDGLKGRGRWTQIRRQQKKNLILYDYFETM